MSASRDAQHGIRSVTLEEQDQYWEREHSRQQSDTAELPWLVKAEFAMFAVALAVGLFVVVLRVAMWGLGF